MIVRQNPGLNERVNRCQFHLVDSGQLEADSSWHFNHICSPFNRLYFIRAGEAFVADASGKTRLLPGRIYLIPAGRNSHYCCPVSMQKVYFHFNLFLPNGFDLFEGLDACLEIRVKSIGYTNLATIRAWRAPWRCASTLTPPSAG